LFETISQNVVLVTLLTAFIIVRQHQIADTQTFEIFHVFTNF